MQILGMEFSKQEKTSVKVPRQEYMGLRDGRAKWLSHSEPKRDD